MDRTDILLPNLATRDHIKSKHVRAVINLNEPVPVDDRRRKPKLKPGEIKLRLLLFDRALHRRVDRREQAHLARIQVLFAMGDIGRRPVHDDPGVDSALGHFIPPRRNAGLRLNRMSVAIATARYKQPYPIHLRNVGRRISGVVGPTARRADVNQFSGLAIKREETMTRSRVLAPASRHARNDHQIAVHSRRNRTSPVRRHEAKLFGQRTFPKQLSVARKRR